MIPRLKLLIAIVVMVGCTLYGQKPIQKDKEATANSTTPQLIELNAVVQGVYIDVCEFTLTDADFGLHLLVTTDNEQELFVHLGPVWATSIWTEDIEGQAVHLVVFSHNYLPENQFVAKELHCNGHVAKFRDEDLVPFWLNGYNQGIW